MAKNRKQDSGTQQRPGPGQTQEKAKGQTDTAEPRSVRQVTPSDVARKHRERRFGHN